jgi:hypothetical protein
MPQPADVRRKQASILFGCLSALLMLGCLVIGTWLLFDFVNRTDHVKIKYISKNFFFIENILDMASYMSFSC